MYKLENNVEWTEALITAFKKNTTYAYLSFDTAFTKTIYGQTITIKDNFEPNAKLEIEGICEQNDIPSPLEPRKIKVVTGNNTIIITNNNSEENYPLNLGTMEMCSLEGFKDTFVYQNNKWYKNKVIEKIILNGTESWSQASGIVYCSSIGGYRKNNNIPLCTHYRGVTNKSAATAMTESDTIAFGSITQNRLYIRDSRFSNANTFKTWLRENNITLYYVLAKAVLEEITDENLIQQLNSIYNVSLYTRTNIINTEIEDENAKPMIKITYSMFLNESNYLKSIELKDYKYVPNVGFIGQACSKMATINLTNDATEYFNLENKSFEIKIGAEYEGNIYYINYGNFIVDSAPENDDTNGTIKVVAYDNMIKFNKPYEDTITYPCTLRALLLNICNQAGVELATNVFANENFEVENNQFEGKTLREVLQNIAKCAFSWARIGQDNKLYLDFKVDNNPTEEIIINDYKQDNYKKANENFGPINKVTFADSDIEGQEESVINQDSIILNGEHELVIKDNYFAYTTQKRRELIQAGTRLFGLTYTPIQDLKMVGLIYLDSNDIIVVNSVDESYIISIPFNHTINYSGYTSDEITSEGITENQKEYENKNTSVGNNSKIEIAVDRANKKIQSIVNQIGDRSEKQTTITQDIDGIELEVGAGLNVLDTIEKRGEIETEEAIDAQVYSIELKGTKEYVAYLHSGDGYSGDSYSNGGII